MMKCCMFYASKYQYFKMPLIFFQTDFLYLASKPLCWLRLANAIYLSLVTTLLKVGWCTSMSQSNSLNSGIKVLYGTLWHS